MPLGLAGLVCCVLLLGLMFRLGQRGLQQERVRMRTDVTTYAGGIQLARCLNILTLSENMRIVARDAVYTEELAEAIGKFQKFFIQAAPWVVEADTIFIGYRNGILAVPIWNQADMADGDSAAGIVPSLKISENGSSNMDKAFKATNRILNVGTVGLANYLGEKATDRALKSFGTQGDGGNQNAPANSFASMGSMLGKMTDGKVGGASDGQDGAYHYQDKDGQYHDLDQSQASAVQEHGAKGGTITRYKDNQSHKYVSKNKGGGGGLSDEGGHYLGTWAIQSPGDQKLGWVLACSQIRVAGGDVDFSDHDHGADYCPFFVPVRGGQDHQSNGDEGGNSPAEGSDDFSALFGVASGLGVNLEPVKAALTAGSDFLEIQH
jgi:hypothetical protein